MAETEWATELHASSAVRARRRDLLILAGFILAAAPIVAITYVARAANRPDLGDLATQLCDPESMLTRDVHQSAQLVTGHVNARSPAGGYSGYRAFVVDRATGHATIAQANWGAECAETGASASMSPFVPNGLPIRP